MVAPTRSVSAGECRRPRLRVEFESLLTLRARMGWTNVAEPKRTRRCSCPPLGLESRALPKVPSMMRRWSALVTWSSLVAYVLGNTHLHLAFAHLSAPRARQDDTVQVQNAATQSRTRGNCCARCRAVASPSVERQQTPAPERGSPVQPALADRDPAAATPCSCCPGSERCCPIPGGCAMCNVAKTPCAAVPPPRETDPAALETSLPEALCLYRSPPGDGVSHPPKA